MAYGDGKFNCKILTIEGDTISAGPEQEFELGGNENAAYGHLTAMTSTQAMYCYHAHPNTCVLLSISGSSVKGVYTLDLPKSRHPQYKGGVQRLWNDRVLACWGGGYHSATYGNPFCSRIICKDQKCTAGEPYNPTSSTKPGFPRSSDIAVTVGVGKVATCVEDNPGFASYLPGGSEVTAPSCAIHNLPHEGTHHTRVSENQLGPLSLP